MLDWLKFRLGEIIGLIHALENRYYQNKTMLRYNFDSVYLYYMYVEQIVLWKMSLECPI